MSVQLLCLELANDLHLMWEVARRPRLQLILSTYERELLQEAGGPNHWDHLDVPLSAIGEFLFDKLQPTRRHDISLAISRGAHARVRLTLCFRGEQVVEREYPEKLFHAAFRASGHVRPLEEVMDHVLETDGTDLKNALRDLANANENTNAKDTSHDAERARWEEVWADEKPVAPKEIEPINVLTLFAQPRQAPPEVAAPTPVSPMKLLPNKSAYVPPGPLRMGQIRLYAESLANGQELPESLSHAAREQILAYVANQQLACA
ncbi:MAG: hypothetical protein WC866_03730 [Patescibacteria group bacterium]|jgi:hypothetical protein